MSHLTKGSKNTINLAVTDRATTAGATRDCLTKAAPLCRISSFAAFVVAVACLITPHLRADGLIAPRLRAASIQLISDDRYVDVSAFAGASEGSMMSSDSRTALSLLPFNANITAHAEWMDTLPPFPGGTPEAAQSDAASQQDSTLSATDVFCRSSVAVGAAGNGSGPFQRVNADALSFFHVSFSVSTPIFFNLSLFDARGYLTAVGATYDQAFDLTSNISGSILGLPVVVGNTSFYTGLLLPGHIYSFQLAQHANTTIPAPTGTHVENTLEAHLTFADVPEPSVFVSLLIGLVIFAIARSKFWRAIPSRVQTRD